MPFESLRQNFKPQVIKVLFIGESRPDGETFFYLENSNLFKYTKTVFETIWGLVFNSNTFKSMGCWLYDVCVTPVNHLPEPQRTNEIQNGIPVLISTIINLKPTYIIAVKRGTFRNTLLAPLGEINFLENRNAFYLPFPAFGQQINYVNQLTDIIQTKGIFSVINPPM